MKTENATNEGDLEMAGLLPGTKVGEETQAFPPPPAAPTASVTGKSLFFFGLLVAQGTCTQTFFKLSQRGGEYKYNTMSAMAIVEFVKLLITMTQLMVEKRGNVNGCISAFQGVNKRVYAAYLFLAISYAVYNQFVFYVNLLVDPGTFGVIKSLGPGVVALLNFMAFGMKLTQAQVYCVLIQICGIIPVTASPNIETGQVEFVYGTKSILVMTGACFYGAFNTIYNANVVKKESANYPMPVQNGILYSFGVILNLFFYFVMKEPGDESFFSGYDNKDVVVLILLNSTVGVTISMVYKYGDAVLKTLAQPVVTAMLLFISKVLFDAPLDIIKIAGAGSVIVSTLLYLHVPAAPPAPAPGKH